MDESAVSSVDNCISDSGQTGLPEEEQRDGSPQRTAVESVEEASRVSSVECICQLKSSTDTLDEDETLVCSDCGKGKYLCDFATRFFSPFGDADGFLASRIAADHLIRDKRGVWERRFKRVASKVWFRRKKKS